MSSRDDAPLIRPLYWAASTAKDLADFPEDVKDVFGYAFHLAQIGGRHPDAKPLKGFGGAGVLEVVTDDAAGTFRGVYTVRYSDAVYVVHVFQKKSKSGIATPKRDVELIESRLKDIEAGRAKQKGKGK